MDEQDFNNRKLEIMSYIKEFRNKYHGKTDNIAKIRYLGDSDEVIHEYRENHEIVDFADKELVEIEDSNWPEADANCNDYPDEVEMINEKGYDHEIFIMFEESDNKIHMLHEVVHKDKLGNSKFPAWLPENNFSQTAVFPLEEQKTMLRKHYLDDAWGNAFVVFVIYGDETSDMPVTEASKIILEETKSRIQKPENNMYTPDFLNTKWTEYVTANSDMYDEKFFAIITTKAIVQTINWDWICKQLNDPDSDSEDED